MNELRCIAHDIIFQLHAAKEQGQIELLLMACTLSHKSLDPDAHRKWVENEHAALAASSANK